MSDPFSSILVPVDFSECSEHALGIAATLARRLGAKLTVLHVVHLPMPVPTFDGTDVVVDYQVLAEHSEATAETEMKRLLERTGLVDDVTARIEVGDPLATIVEVLKDIGGDLVVMGTHGRTGLSRLIMGSVTDRVLRTAPCPVLAVRSGADEKARSEDEASR